MINKYSYCCNNMEMLIGEEAVIYNEVFDEYCFPLHEDKISVVRLEYCPWCGTKLPKSKREEWFVQLEALGYENPLYCEDIPKEFKSNEWRSSMHVVREHNLGARQGTVLCLLATPMAFRKFGEIATPVCATLRNDTDFRQAIR